MSASTRPKKSRDGEPSAIELIEEAVHLLRRAPASALAIYYAGVVPFVLGLLFFWAYITWFHPEGEVVAWAALGLAGLFIVMKAAQAEFCARLVALRLGAEPADWSPRRLARFAVAQLRLQPWVTLVLVPAAVVAVPFGWVWAYGQNVTVMGEEAKLHDEAAAQAKLWPAQNHHGLLLISAIAGCMWLNIGTSFYAVPWLANRILGIENMFGFSGWWFLNTTFLASVTALTWLTMDPLVKAFYTLRVFHGRARRTGEDVRVEFQLARRGLPLRAAALLVVGLLALAPRVRVRGAEPVPAPKAGTVSTTVPVTAVRPEQLDRAIDQVLAGDDFRWRLPPPPGKEKEEKDGPLMRFLRQGAEMTREVFRSIGRFFGRIGDWFSRHFTNSSSPDPTAARAAGAGLAGVGLVLLYVFIVVAALLILWVIWLLIARARKVAMPVLQARAVAVAAPDLRDENVQAAMLPADGWLAMAREQAARGEWRLAWRALYLATLARLAAEGLLSLAKFKTNLDYEREVRRRALSRTEVVTGFAARRRAFEDVWYGREQAVEASVREWMAELERPNTP